MAKQAVYLDHNASAPLLPEARDAVIAALDLVGNPSSVHAQGRALKALIEDARDAVALLAGAERGQVVFTGSATEAITQAIVGGVAAYGLGGIVIGATEHAAVARAAEATGLPVSVVPVDGDGRLALDELAALLAEATAYGRVLLVALQAVNNETGVVQPLDRIGALVGPTPHVLFIDAVQALGKLPLEFAAGAPDMMAVSGHKIGAPAGIGALLMKAHADGVRLIPGGGQELGRRGGTEAAALIAGFGAAARAFPARYSLAGTADLATALEAGTRKLAPDVVVFGSAAERVGNVVDFAVPGLGNAVALMALDLAGISVSAGSACSSGKVGRSPVLSAMGIAPELADGALRVSFGWSSTPADVEAFLGAFEVVLARRNARVGRAA